MKEFLRVIFITVDECDLKLCGGTICWWSIQREDGAKMKQQYSSSNLNVTVTLKKWCRIKGL